MHIFYLDMDIFLYPWVKSDSLYFPYYFPILLKSSKYYSVFVFEWFTLVLKTSASATNSSAPTLKVNERDIYIHKLLHRRALSYARGLFAYATILLREYKKRLPPLGDQSSVARSHHTLTGINLEHAIKTPQSLKKEISLSLKGLPPR